MTWQTWTRPALLTCALTLTLGTLPAAASEEPVTQADYGAVETIRLHAQEYGVSAAWLERTLRCESRLDPRAIGAAGEQGAAQLASFGLLPLFYQRGYSDPFDFDQAVTFTAWAFSQGLSSHWTCAR